MARVFFKKKSQKNTSKNGKKLAKNSEKMTKKPQKIAEKLQKTPLPPAGFSTAQNPQDAKKAALFSAA